MNFTSFYSQRLVGLGRDRSVRVWLLWLGEDSAVRGLYWHWSLQDHYTIVSHHDHTCTVWEWKRRLCCGVCGVWEELFRHRPFANIRKDNNSFKWSDDGKTWTVLHIPTGCYELKAINAEITRIGGNSNITILPNVNTLQCILTVVGGKVSFDVPNSLASVLGFKQDIVYGVGHHSSYMRGTQAPVVYNFFPNAAPGQ